MQPRLCSAAETAKWEPAGSHQSCVTGTGQFVFHFSDFLVSNQTNILLPFHLSQALSHQEQHGDLQRFAASSPSMWV